MHLSGNVYVNDVDETSTNFRIAEWTLLYLNIDEVRNMFENDTFYDYINERVAYLGDITQAGAISICNEFFDGEPGTHLDIYDITNDTPCGNYWWE